ncbi:MULTISPECIES: GTP-binding protein [unclassified Synechocystis]|uniref:GTP-binding protein n=1 Tax=unclassified Synechocystis TaxID=2640012 RepID=UPI00042311FF|nr:MULTISPECIES: GTP-binding protein [unclassified Synechocystis]AIE74748.1 Small GTP-binding protein domain [Synechocystis sp. PCC 6714]MCT0253906.1 GTP-binding protein [Synechocystis sp. CS-94]
MSSFVPDSALSAAIASIQQSLNWYASQRRHWNYPPNPELQGAVRQDIQAMNQALAKLEQRIFKIAAFGLVSRGKSTVINALLGEKRLETGPLHGVTQWPQSVRWSSNDKIQIDLIDTPGLDEIAGGARAAMAQTVAQQADLILFVIAGDITQTEFIALQTLRRAQKPLLLVFNKIDLYPEQDQGQIFEQLQALTPPGEDTPIFSPQDIVLVSADPPPIPVRLEYGDRPTEERWEKPEPQLDQLRQKIFTILNRDGSQLLALNALRQVEQAEQNIATKTIQIRTAEADQLISKYMRYKALAIAANPIGLLDLAASLITDLLLIRGLARLYGLPITSHEAGRIWKKVLIGSGGILLSQWVSALFLGLQKTVSLFENPGNLAAYAGGAVLQGGVAAYSTYIVGEGTKIYLAQGASWGNTGTSTAIAKIQNSAPPESMLRRLVDGVDNPS